MARCEYEIEYLPSFDKEFDETLYYIMYKLNNKEAAKKLIANTQKAILDRSINPEGFEVYKERKNKCTKH